VKVVGRCSFYDGVKRVLLPFFSSENEIGNSKQDPFSVKLEVIWHPKPQCMRKGGQVKESRRGVQRH